MIIANAKGQTLKLQGEAVVSDSVEYLKIKFITDSEWSGYVKTAVFRDTAGNACSVVFTQGNPLYLGEDCCYVPHEVIKAPEFTVSLFGVKGAGVITTPEISVFVIQSGYGEGAAPQSPTPTEYEQILSVATDARTVALSVRADAENGAFQGEKGDKGDRGDRGYSGVYVGSGDMPEGYNVQIDPDGSTVDMNTLVTTQYVDEKIANLDFEVDLTDYPTKSELADELYPIKQDIAALGVDYITERGEAEVDGVTWSWEKWASGKAVCWGKQEIDITISSQEGSVYFQGVAGVDFPFEFLQPPVLQVSYRSSSNQTVWLASGSSIANVSKSNTGYSHLYRGSSGPATGALHYYAVGQIESED